MRFAAGWLLATLLVSPACSRATGHPQAAASSDASGSSADDGSGARSSSPRAVEVAAGTLHSCALLTDGRAVCWGSNDHGQLGAAANDVCVVEDLLHNAQPPLRTACRAEPASVDGLIGAVQIAAAGSTTCARLAVGTVRCWGQNSSGLVGDGTTTDRPRPTEVSGLTHVAEIAIGPTHACARTESGTVSCWGENFFGQLGTPPKDPGRDVIAREGYAAVKELSPVLVPGLDQVVEIAVGDKLTCARRRNDDVVCFGQLAAGIPGSASPSVVAALHGVTKLALGHGSHCGLDAAGTARCWGANGSGQLLDGTRAARPAPVVATGVPALSQIAWAANRGCAATVAGEILCWGDNGTGGVDGPRRVVLPTRASRVALGANHGCALGGDGSVACWGDAFYGATGTRAGAVPTSAFWTPPRRVLP